MSIQHNELFKKSSIDIYKQNIVISVNNYNKAIYSFPKKFVDITPEQISFTGEEAWINIDTWFDDKMLYYTEQYKFALYCASTLCGVSKYDLTSGIDLTRSIFNFHVMYQTKKILKQLQARENGDPDFNPYKNPYNETEYKKLLNEFNVNPYDIPSIDQPTDGLGFVGNLGKRVALLLKLRKPPLFRSTGQENWYMNMKPKGSKNRSGIQNNDWGGYYQFAGDHGDKEAIGVLLDKIQQNKFDYTRLIIDKSRGLTHPGIIRLNDSIRTYVYCLLGAQVQARSEAGGVITTGASLAAQQEFLTLVNDMINLDQSLQDSIKNFEDACSKSSSAIDYVIAKQVYMIPSNMNLNKLGQVVDGFNDKIQVAGAFDKIGVHVTKHPKLRVERVVPEKVVKPVEKPVRIPPVVRPVDRVIPPKVVTPVEKPGRICCTTRKKKKIST